MAERRPAKGTGAATETPAGGATIGHEAELWAMADALRGSMDAAEYKHKDYALPALDKRRLGQLIDLIGNIRMGDEDARSHDLLGRVARKLGRMVDRTHRDLADEDIARIADTYRAWRTGNENGDDYADVPGFCKSASLDEVRRHGHVLTPGRYVGAEPQPDDGEPFEAKMRRLVVELREQQAEGARLDAAYFASNRQADRLHFKDLFRHAARHSLIAADAAERWLRYRDNRNDTAHDYGEDFAEATLKLLPAFVEDARSLAAVIERNDDG